LNKTGRKTKNKKLNPDNKNNNKNLLPLEKFFNAKIINEALQEFFGLNPLSQFMDQTNPLSEITHKRRFTSLGPGGVDRETAGMAIRGIHPTHYGRICPIETPEGQNAGLVNSITTHGFVDFSRPSWPYTSKTDLLGWFGDIKTPFYKIYKGQVQRELGPIFLSSEQEQKMSIVPGDIFVNSIDFLPGSRKKSKHYLSSEGSAFFSKQALPDLRENVSSSWNQIMAMNQQTPQQPVIRRKAQQPVAEHPADPTGPSSTCSWPADFGSVAPCRVNLLAKHSEKHLASQSSSLHNNKTKKKIPVRQGREFKRVYREIGNYMIISPIQMISIATSLIPFLEHDDANRALMGSNMQRQAVPLICSNRPIIGTGLESRCISDSGQAGLAPVAGLLSYVSSNKILIFSRTGEDVTKRKALTKKNPVPFRVKLFAKKFRKNSNYRCHLSSLRDQVVSSVIGA
jgi:DNA-directed RNA polymerase beta subunit